MLNIVVTLYCFIAIFVILFHGRLLFGKAWGAYVLGGRYPNVLPLWIRIVPLFYILIFILLSSFVLYKTQNLFLGIRFPNYFVWFFLFFHCLDFVSKQVSDSQKEKKLWQPLTLILLICSILITIL